MTPNPETTPAEALSAPSRSALRDWPGDFAHENGNYMCRCFTCGEYFTGRKWRWMCKKCADEAAAWWASLTPDQATAELEQQQQQAMNKLMDSRPSQNSKDEPKHEVVSAGPDRLLALLNEVYVFIAMKHRACDPWRKALDDWQGRVENQTGWDALDQIEKSRANPGSQP